MSNFGVNQLAQGHIPLIHLTGRTIRGQHIQKDTCLLQATEKRLGVSQIHKEQLAWTCKREPGFSMGARIAFVLHEAPLQKKKKTKNNFGKAGKVGSAFKAQGVPRELKTQNKEQTLPPAGALLLNHAPARLLEPLQGAQHLVPQEKDLSVSLCVCPQWLGPFWLPAHRSMRG